jgi:hypothetical protein
MSGLMSPAISVAAISGRVSPAIAIAANQPDDAAAARSGEPGWRAGGFAAGERR